MAGARGPKPTPAAPTSLWTISQGNLGEQRETKAEWPRGHILAHSPSGESKCVPTHFTSLTVFHTVAQSMITFSRPGQDCAFQRARRPWAHPHGAWLQRACHSRQRAARSAGFARSDDETEFNAVWHWCWSPQAPPPPATSLSAPSAGWLDPCAGRSPCGKHTPPSIRTRTQTRALAGLWTGKRTCQCPGLVPGSGAALGRGWGWESGPGSSRRVRSSSGHTEFGIPLSPALRTSNPATDLSKATQLRGRGLSPILGRTPETKQSP